jgi:hypothetical protein
LNELTFIFLCHQSLAKPINSWLSNPGLLVVIKIISTIGMAVILILSSLLVLYYDRAFAKSFREPQEEEEGMTTATVQ